MIDLDEMKETWARQEARQDEKIRLNRQILRQIQLKAGESRLHRLLGFTAVHALAWFVCMVILGSFIHAHFGEPHLALAAAVLDLYAIGFLIALIRQIVMVAAIDYSLPVTAIQKQVEAVRIQRIRTTQWAILAGWVVWVPFFMVLFQGLLSVDIYRLFGGGWVAANVVAGLASIPLVLWISRNFRGRLGQSPFLQRIMKDLAGSNLNAASEFLAALSRFEQESA